MGFAVTPAIILDNFKVEFELYVVMKRGQKEILQIVPIPYQYTIVSCPTYTKLREKYPGNRIYRGTPDAWVANQMLWAIALKNNDKPADNWN